ncbi:hypothetical protein D3C81_2071650 [compost metagenome]
MAPGITQQVIEDLAQLVRVHQGFEIPGADVQMNVLVLACYFAGLRHEVLQPRFQVEPLRHGLFAAGQLQDVFDDTIHALGVILNNLRQTSVRGIQFL